MNCDSHRLRSSVRDNSSGFHFVASFIKQHIGVKPNASQMPANNGDGA